MYNNLQIFKEWLMSKEKENTLEQLRALKTLIDTKRELERELKVFYCY